jgi:hypothetical protein
MAAFEVDADEGVITIAPVSSLYNPNSPNVVASSFGGSALADYYITTQTLDFQLVRQNYIDPSVNSLPGWFVGQSPNNTCQATNNRIFVYGTVTVNAQIVRSVLYNSQSTRIPHTFQAFGAASGFSGNGMYTSGLGSIATLQPGQIIRPVLPFDFEYTTVRQFWGPVFIASQSWESNPSAQFINNIIFWAAYNAQSFIPEFRRDILFA